MDTSKNPWEDIPTPELVPVTPGVEKGRKTPLDVINGGLNIINKIRQENGDDDEEVTIQKPPTLN